VLVDRQPTGDKVRSEKGVRRTRAHRNAAVSRAAERSPAATASRAADLARQLRRLEPRVVAPPPELDGDYAQAVADGAVDVARRRLERRIRAHMPGGALEVSFTDNRYTMISVRREPSRRRYRLRVHHMFADAGAGVTRALARYVCDNDAGASRLLGRFIDEHQHRVRPRRAKAKLPVVTDGACFDLREIFDDLNRRYFGGAIDARITWGARGGRRSRRTSIKMGSYSVEDRLIRIHRTLDRPFVPRYFVEWIVYHEMLHQVHAAPVVDGRRRFHTPAFCADEARFERYPEARAWERANIERILDF
jgi:hypothetical protein